MPRPAYMMLSKSGTFDQTTNAASFFDVVEIISVSLTPTDAEGKPIASKIIPFVFRFVNTWIKDEHDDSEQEFESYAICKSPSGVMVFECPTSSFRFTGQFHRMFVTDLTLQGFPELGSYEIRAKIRKAGEEEWLAEQTFPFIVAENPRIPAQEAPAPSPPAG